MAQPQPAFTPYVPPDQAPPEFTARAVLLGALFGLLFGASTVYLGLRAGLTVSASIPIAVLAISVLKRFGGSTILENNIVQTIGSAGESVAAGVVFTIPALIFLTPHGPAYFNYFQITVLAFAGGILGVLLMVPLRRALIVKEHGVLPYPEGAACADVLIAGERGGQLASLVFQGLGIGALFKALPWIFQIVRTEVGYTTPKTSAFPNATLNVDISPEYMGVGYVIGPRIAGEMVAGGVLSWMVLLPLLTIVGAYMPTPFPPAPPDGLRIVDMAPGQIWSQYIRYIGAGAVLAAGLITLARDDPDDRRVLPRQREGLPRRERRTRAAAHRARPPHRHRPGWHPAAGRVPGGRPRHADTGQSARRPARRRLRLLLRDGRLTHRRPDREFVEPGVGHDHRHPDPDLHDLCRHRLDRRRLRADRPDRRRGGLHRRRQRRRDLAGSQDRLHRRRHAPAPAGRPRGRRARLGPHHRT